MLSQKRDSEISEIKFGTKIEFQNTKETDYLIIKNDGS